MQCYLSVNRSMHQLNHQIKRPSTPITFLGIHLNTITMEASITTKRKEFSLQELYHLYSQPKCTKWQLSSLNEKLSFSCKVLPAGRIFLHRLIDLSTTVKQLHCSVPYMYLSYTRMGCPIRVYSYRMPVSVWDGLLSHMSIYKHAF